MAAQVKGKAGARRDGQLPWPISGKAPSDESYRLTLPSPSSFSEEPALPRAAGGGPDWRAGGALSGGRPGARGGGRARGGRGERARAAEEVNNPSARERPLEPSAKAAVPRARPCSALVRYCYF